MRSLSFLTAVAATASATASLQRRQDSLITIDSPVLSGSLCSAASTSIIESTNGNTLTVGFSEYMVFTEEAPSGECTIDMTLIYPPGCITALMNVDLHSFFEGVEGVTATMNVTMSLSSNRHSVDTEVYQNQGQALEDQQAPYLRSYPMDASMSFNQEEPAEVNLSISLGTQIESETETYGKFTMDDISIGFVTEDLDSNWESCM